MTQRREFIKKSVLGTTGNYKSSEGLEGHGVWGTCANWVSLSGTIKDEKVEVRR